MTLHQTDLAVEALRPGEEGYDEAAETFFGTGRPALVVRPRGPEEVAAALDHAARHDLPVSIRSGGHSPLADAANPGGIVLDMARLDR
ncbi:MAG TPA: FAD-binding protein, partial [Mycobacteriales bacterium]|nr:FAD-binding protein [Mycobacteriales bacterium]